MVDIINCGKLSVRIIGKEQERDIRIPNDAFSLWGRMLPSYIDGKWDYSIEKWEADQIDEMCFPDENYDYDQMSQDSIFVGAYLEGKCVGLAVAQKGFFKYMYLLDLKVKKEYRRQGIGELLIEALKKIATDKGYRGLYLQGQDNNLSACLFYIKTGFRIGGLDTEVYKGTKQEGKADILFYLDC